MKYITPLIEWFRNLESRTRLYLGIAVSVLLLLAIAISALNGKIAELSRKRLSREADLVQMLTLRQQWNSARMLSQRFSNRLASAHADDSPEKVIEEIGIKGKSSKITPGKGEQNGQFFEDTSEVKLEGLTANEAVNLVYRLENGTRPVIIKRALFKTRFDDPSRLDLTLTIALLKPSNPGQQ